MLLVVACTVCQVGDIYPIRASDVVILQEFGRGGPLARLLTAPALDMKSLLAACLGRVETTLRMVPDILGVRFPQYRDDAGGGSEDEELVWVQDELDGALGLVGRWPRRPCRVQCTDVRVR